LCNLPDTRVSRFGHASEFYEVSVASSDAQKLGPDAAYANPSLSRIKIFETYLKRLIGCVLERIHSRIFIVLRESVLTDIVRCANSLRIFV
jgi:hypothetical protein